MLLLEWRISASHWEESLHIAPRCLQNKDYDNSSDQRQLAVTCIKQKPGTGNGIDD